jgi:hypothetical protein
VIKESQKISDAQPLSCIEPAGKHRNSVRK